MIDHAITLLAPRIGARDARAAAGRSRATHSLHHRSTPALLSSPRPRRNPAPQPRALTSLEKAAVLDALHSARFTDMTPAERHGILLDKGVHLCSVATMYRLLGALGETGERHCQATHPARQKPDLMAREPNRVWSWGITKLKSPAKWSYFDLYLIIDIFSRYPVGWLLATQESAVLAEKLLADTIPKPSIEISWNACNTSSGRQIQKLPQSTVRRWTLSAMVTTRPRTRRHRLNATGSDHGIPSDRILLATSISRACRQQVAPRRATNWDSQVRGGRHFPCRPSPQTRYRAAPSS